MDDDETQVKAMMGMTLADIVQHMDDFGQTEFNIGIEFEDAVLTVLISLTDGKLH